MRAVLTGVTKVALYPRVRAVLWHRVAHQLWQNHRLRPLALLVQARALRTTGAEIHPAATIGGGLLLGHSAGVVIGPTTVVGRDVILFQGVTLGDALDGRHGQPRIGDRVLIAAGACVLGPISVGDDARVGANAVVLQDVPAAAVAVGVPARLIAPLQH